MENIKDFKIIKKLGSGHYGNVYLSSKISKSQIPFALKIISLQNSDNNEKESLVKECHILNRLMHPHIVLYYESFLHFISDDEVLCIVMEYCDGGSLFDVINALKKENKCIPEKIVWKWFIQLIYALKYVHNKRIIHRDIKPMNILLSSEKKPEENYNEQMNPNEPISIQKQFKCDIKIADFGVSRILETSSMAETLIGSPLYLSPEAINGETYNSKVDIWAIGCSMYELIQLSHPFEARNTGALIKKILEGKYSPITNKQYSQELIELIDSCLIQDPSKRISCEEFLNLNIVKEKAVEVGIYFDDSYEELNFDLDSNPISFQNDENKINFQSSFSNLEDSSKIIINNGQRNDNGKKSTSKMYSHCIPPRPVSSKKATLENPSRIRRPPSSLPQRNSPQAPRKGLQLRSNNRINASRRKDIESVQNLPDYTVDSETKPTRSTVDKISKEGVIEMHVKQPELFQLLSTQPTKNEVKNYQIGYQDDSLDLLNDNDLAHNFSEDEVHFESPSPTWKLLEDENEERYNDTYSNEELELFVQKSIELEKEIADQIGEHLLQEFISFFVENPSLSEEKIVQFAFGKISYSKAAVVPLCKELVELRSIEVLQFRIQKLESKIINEIDELHYREILSFFLQKRKPTENDIHRFVFGRISFEKVGVLHIIRQIASMQREIVLKSVLKD